VIAVRWRRAMALTSFVPRSAQEVHEQLLALTDQAIGCLLSDPFQPAQAQAIGAALVRLHYAQSEALEYTQEVLADALSMDAADEQAVALQSRLTMLLAALAVGFLRQAQAKTLREQEEIRGALMAQRERAEQAMAQQFVATERARGQLSAVLDATGDAMILVSPDRLAITVNRSFEELLALPADTTLGRSLADLEPHLTRVFGDINKLRTLVEQVTGTETRGTQDLVQVWPQSRVLQLISTPVHGADHQLIGRLHVLRDVTGEREVDRMKSEFVSLVSHELRTPLTSIKGYVDLLLAGEVGEVAAEQQEFLTIVKNNSDRLVALVSDLLDLSRIEAGRIDLRYTTLDLSALVGSVVATFRPQVERKGQQVVLELADTLPAVMGDSDRVTQILTNLVSNAHKYTPSGGRITTRGTDPGGRRRTGYRQAPPALPRTGGLRGYAGARRFSGAAPGTE
jgi:signal transduction histidine kinase